MLKKNSTICWRRNKIRGLIRQPKEISAPEAESESANLQTPPAAGGGGGANLQAPPGGGGGAAPDPVSPTGQATPAHKGKNSTLDEFKEYQAVPVRLQFKSPIK